MKTGELLAAIDGSDLDTEVKDTLRERLTPQYLPQIIDPEISARIATANCSDEGQRAMRAVAVGIPPWVALQNAGVADIAEMWLAIEEAGLVQTDVPSLLDRKAKIVALTDARIEARLLDPSQKVSLFELNAVSGTATDKLLKAAPPTDRASEVQALIERLHARGGGKASVTTTVEVDPDAIDVTAEPVS